MRNEKSEPCIAAPARAGVKRSTARTILYGICRPCKGGEGLFANAEFARADKQNISSRQTVSEKPNDHEKIYIFGKKCIISAFFLQLSAKKNNKDYIKTLDTEQNADYTIMDWVY